MQESQSAVGNRLPTFSRGDRSGLVNFEHIQLVLQALSAVAYFPGVAFDRAASHRCCSNFYGYCTSQWVSISNGCIGGHGCFPSPLGLLNSMFAWWDGTFLRTCQVTHPLDLQVPAYKGPLQALVLRSRRA